MFDGAVCAQTDPDLFFPEKGDSPRIPKALCAGCPLTVACLEYALTHEEGMWGVWGGTTALERRRIRMSRGLKVVHTNLRRKVEVRLRAGMTREQVAADLGIHPDSVSRFLRDIDTEGWVERQPLPQHLPPSVDCSHCASTWRELRHLIRVAQRREKRGLPIDTSAIEKARDTAMSCAVCRGAA